MKLYRFEKNDTKGKRLQTIIDGNIFISNPKSFNDLNDCSLNEIFSFNRDDASYAKMEVILRTLYESEDTFPLGADTFRLLKKFLLNEKPNIDKPLAQKNKSEIIEKIHYQVKHTTGVCCFFNGAPRHPLMWAHYADKHTGFCIEYEVIDPIQDTPLHEVNYVTKPLLLSIDELLLCPAEAFTRLLTAKSCEWHYEREFRLIYLNSVKFYENGTTIPLPKTIKPFRLITGDRFCHSTNEQLIKTLGIDVIDYKKFMTEKSSPSNNQYNPLAVRNEPQHS